MTTPLFDYSIAAELRRLADAAERQAAAQEEMLAIARAHVTPAAPTPADFDGAQYAFDTMMGDPLAALGNLTAKPTAADPGDEDDSNDGKPRIRVFWSKYDPRSRELARLRTAANHRAAAAKTPAVRDAATLEAQQHHNEAKARHSRFRRWLAEGRVAIIKGELVVYNGAKSFTWRSEYLQAPNYILTLPE